MNIVSIIPKGSKNAISRRQLLIECKEHGIAQSDREMRRKISEARTEFAILNTQSGKGYFIPDKNDVAELRHYIAQERDRSMTILSNLKMARNMLEDMECNRI